MKRNVGGCIAVSVGLGVAGCSSPAQRVEYVGDTNGGATAPPAATTSTPPVPTVTAPITAKGPFPVSTNPALLDPSLAKETAPAEFRVEFKTTTGDFSMDCHRAWAPNGADRLYNLVKIGFFDDVAFFRVVMTPEPFVAQFGIHGDPRVTKAWTKQRIAPDPVTQSNTPGTVTFAMAGKPDTRTTQIFVNIGDNPGLDELGFAPVCALTSGSLETVKKLYSGYGEGPTKEQGDIMTKGNAFLRDKRPELDYVATARIVPVPPASGGLSSTSTTDRPKGTTAVGGASVSGGTVSNAGAVVAGMVAGFRACYNRGLAEDPNMKGTVRVSANIGPNGEVLSTSATSSGTLSATVVSCVQARVVSAQFAPPEGGAATLVIPVTFQPDA